jgi:hypothetical protein
LSYGNDNHEYLIDDNFKYNKSAKEIKLSFNHPLKELIWF